MSQDYQSIGRPSSELEAVAARHQGWGPTASQPAAGDIPEPMTIEITDRSDYSFRDRRANLQLFQRNPHAGGSSMAGYVEPPMASVQVHPDSSDGSVDRSL